MSTNLTAVFKGVDEISAVFDKMASSGAQAVNQWETAGSAASDAFETATTGAGSAAQAMNSADSSAKSLQQASTGLNKEMGALSKTVDQNAESFDNLEDSADSAGATTSDSVAMIANALAAAGIMKLVNDITQAVIEMANEFSRAQSTIAKSSGAVGAELRALSSSMMNVYSGVPDSIDAVANTLATLNTMTGKTGQELEKLTDLTLKYARVNNEDAGASAANLGRLMNALDLDTGQLSKTMDQLTLASQMSGLGVNALTDYIIAAGPSFEEMGFSVERSIALFSSFYKAGAEPRELLSSLNILLNRMASEGATNAEEAFNMLLESIKDAPDILSATTIASEAFGARVGAKVADDIRAGRFEIDDWVDALQNSHGVLEQTAVAAMTLEEKWAQATNSISTAFSSILNPAVNDVSSAFAGLVEKIGNYLQDHPGLTNALTILGITLTVVAVAIGGLMAAFALKMALLPILTGQVAIFGITLSAAIWPITLIVAGIAALVTIGMVLFNWLGNTNNEYKSLTATSRAHYDEVSRLSDEYDRAVSVYGENSAAAQKLAADLEGARLVYEKSKMTLQEFREENDRLVESNRKWRSELSESAATITENAASSGHLINKLEELSSKTNRTTGEHHMLLLIIEQLNEQFPNLALSYDQVTGSLNKSVEALRQIKYEQEVQEYLAWHEDAAMRAIGAERALGERLELAQENARLAQNYLDELEASRTAYAGRGSANKVASEQTAINAARRELEAYNTEVSRLQGEVTANNQILENAQVAFDTYSTKVEEAAEEVVELISKQEALELAFESVNDELKNLIESYDKAYDAAHKSISSTVGLFNEMATETKLSIKDMTDAMASQLTFIETYTENLRKAAEYGLDEGLIASLSDGSKESAGQIDLIVKEIEKLGGATGDMAADAQAFVNDFNSSFQEVQTAKDEFATTVAEMSTDFSTGMDDIEARLRQAISEMDMSTEAAAAAQRTIGAYVNAFNYGMNSLGRSASASSQYAANMQNRNNSNAGLNIPGFASGTPSADSGWALVGEQGPELVNFNGGEAVYTADETNRMLANASQFRGTDFNRHIALDTNADEISGSSRSDANGLTVSEEKKITLDINGSGEFNVGAGVDEDVVWEIMATNLKPILMGLLRQEIFEEGDRSYAF